MTNATYRLRHKMIDLFRLTIGTKLVGLIAVLLIASVVLLVWLSTRMFSDDNTALIQQMNADKAASLSAQLRDQLESLTDKMRILGTVLNDNSAEARESLVREFFAKDKDFLALFVSQNGVATPSAKAISPDLSANDPDAAKILAEIGQEHDFSYPQLFRGEIQITSLRAGGETPLIALGIPFIQGANGTDFSHVLTAVIKPSRIAQAFSDSDIITTYLVDRHGKLLAHPDIHRVMNGENVSHLPIVALMLQGKATNEQTRYVDSTNASEAVPKLAAYRMLGFAGMGIVAEVAEAKAFEAAQRVKYRSMLLGFIILCGSFLVGYLFSGTISNPIKMLVAAAGRISSGDFKINLKAKGRDEVAQLSRAFNEMALGLEERDRVKSTFSKFHSKEVADKLLSGEVKLGGERKEATIFFSDVRGFTGMSESMQPEQVVEMLNEYMTRMVKIIQAHGGIVDKYVGDAIMALWGVPLAKGEEAIRAVRASLEMRLELAKLNELRISRGQPVLRIGMGVNTGPVIAGNIGSDEKMEYTVIGDSVNLASRIESMTKEYGTDLLISSRVHEQVKDYFTFEKCKTAKVKGKSQAIEVFKVTGYIENGQTVAVETPYSSYAAEKSDKVVHEKSEDKAEPAAESAVEIEMPDRTGLLQLDGTSQINIRSLRAEANHAEKINQEMVESSQVYSGPTPPPFTHFEAYGITTWFVKLGQEALGPFSRDEMTEALRSHDFPVEIEVSKNPQGAWKSALETEEFAEVIDEMTRPKVAA